MASLAMVSMSPTRQFGQIKWFSAERGVGVIEDAAGALVLLAAKGKTFVSGDVVTFRVKTRPSGRLQATHVQRIVN